MTTSPTTPVSGSPSAAPAAPSPATALTDLDVAGDPLALPGRAVPPPAQPATVAGLAALVRQWAEAPDRWEPLVTYDAFSRGYARLAAGPGHELWLLTWLPGQGTGTHGHGAAAGVFAVVRGELTERTDRARDPGRVLRPGVRRVCAPYGAHEIVNAALRPAVSVHGYLPGLTEMPLRPRRAAAEGHRPHAAQRCAAPR